MNKIKTMDLKGNDYAKVKERIKAFRSENPRGKIETKPEFMSDNRILFKAYVLKDKADESSADATGHAVGVDKGQKAFEKLETIAIGRALATLGYAADGEIASSEEMEAFMEYQQEQAQEKMTEYAAQLSNSKNMEDLKSVWATIDGDYKKGLEELKNKIKAQHESKDVSK